VSVFLTVSVKALQDPHSRNSSRADTTIFAISAMTTAVEVWYSGWPSARCARDHLMVHLKDEEDDDDGGGGGGGRGYLFAEEQGAKGEWERVRIAQRK
jgi:hypothetical protein